jgi:hypothetical protein
MQPVTAEPQPGRKPKPLPTWIKLRLAATTLVNPSCVSNIIALPFGKVLKLDVPANEIAAIEFVRANTTIPVPKSGCQSIFIRIWCAG